MRRGRGPRALLAIGLAVFVLTYANSLGNAFQYDDFHSIVENTHLRDVGTLLARLGDAAVFSAQPERAMFRPLVVASLALNYAAGEFDVTGYHLANLAAHLACTCLVAALSAQLGLSWAAAGLAALIFALHPAQAEVANYISSRSESLATLGYLGSLVLYLRWRDHRRRLTGTAAVAAYGASLLCKATAISLPVVIASLEFLRQGRKRGARALLTPLYAVYLGLTAAYVLVVRQLAGQALSTPVRPLLDQAATQIKAGVYYLYVLTMPVRLSVEHGFSVSTWPGDTAVALALALLASVGAVAVQLNSGRRDGLWGFLLLAGAVAILPASLVPLNVLVNEHRLYLPLAFLAPIAALALPPAWPPRRVCGQVGLLAGGAAVAVALLALLTHQRNRVWADELSLWRDAARKAPAAYRAHLHLGGALEKAGDLERALAAYERAAFLAPAVAETHYNQANALRALGHPGRARDAYSRALSVDPGLVPALVNLATMEQEAGALGRAADLLTRACDQWPAAPDLRRRLGVVLSAQRRWPEAEATLIRARDLDPRRADTHYNLANMYSRSGRNRQAAGSYRRVLELQDDHAGARNNLADLLVRLGRYGEARALALEGLGRYPAQAKLLYQLARALEGEGELGEAAARYREYLDRGRPDPGIRDRIYAHVRALEARQTE